MRAVQLGTHPGAGGPVRELDLDLGDPHALAQQVNAHPGLHAPAVRQRSRGLEGRAGQAALPVQRLGRLPAGGPADAGPGQADDQAMPAELDRRGDPGRFDRSKAPVIMDLLKRQLLSPHYIQHSARVLFVVGQASAHEREQIMQAIFDLSREEVVTRVQSGKLSKAALAAHDYVYDVFEVKQRPVLRAEEKATVRG